MNPILFILFMMLVWIAFLWRVKRSEAEMVIMLVITFVVWFISAVPPWYSIR